MNYRTKPTKRSSLLIYFRSREHSLSKVATQSRSSIASDCLFSSQIYTRTGFPCFLVRFPSLIIPIRTDIRMAPKRYVYTSLRDDLVLRPLFETLLWSIELALNINTLWLVFVTLFLKFSWNHRHYRNQTSNMSSRFFISKSILASRLSSIIRFPWMYKTSSFIYTTSSSYWVNCLELRFNLDYTQEPVTVS